MYVKLTYINGGRASERVDSKSPPWADSNRIQNLKRCYTYS